MLFLNTHPRLSTRVVGSDDSNLCHITPLDRHSCTHPLREFNSSDLPRHHHAFTSTFASREKFHIPWSRKLSHLPATPTHSLRGNHTCNRSPRRHRFVSACIKPTVINVSAHLSPLTTTIWKSKTQSHLFSTCSSTQLSCGLQLWPSTMQFV